MRHVAGIPALGLLAGAALGLLISDPPSVFAYVLLSTSVAGAMFAWALRRPLWLAVSVALGFFAGGMLLAAVEWQRAWRPPLRLEFERLARAARVDAARENRRLPEDDEAFAIVEGILRADAAPSAGGVSLSVAADRVENPTYLRDPVNPTHPTHPTHPTDQPDTAARAAATGGVLITVVGSLAPLRMADWRAGRRVRFPVQLRRPSRYLDAGVPDHERALARRGTTLVGTVKSGALVEVVERASWVDEGLGAARQVARNAIAAAVSRWSPTSGAIVAAIVLGDRAGLDDAVERRLQEAGTYHVIAISGGNIAILAGLLVGLFRLAGRLGRTAMLVSIGALVVYARFVGGGASVDRATLMAVVYFGARAIDQRSPPLNTLAVAAAILAAADPLAVAEPAFLLTFGATLAILAAVPVPAAPEKSLAAAAGSAAQTLLVASVAAELMLFPVGALAFSRITVAGLALNFCAIPLMALAQVAGMAVVPAAFVSGTLASSIGWFAHAGATGLVRSADLVAYLPALTWRVAPPHWSAVVLYYGAGAVCFALWRRRYAGVASQERRLPRGIRRLSAALAAAAAVWMLVNPESLLAARGDGALHIAFLDVGQGDASFIVFPRGQTMLVDAGGLAASASFDIGDRVVAPVLRQAGFRRLDYLVLTHGDPDHIGGAASILDEFRPREVWEGIPVPRFEPLARLRLAARVTGARWASVQAGSRIVIDGVEVVARHPEAADWERPKVRNDDSLVLELRWRDVSVLLTGDIGRAVERQIAPTIPTAPLRIVKVPHHGSLTSSAADFVEALRPRIAVVSAGRGNHFGHPVPEVLERYRAAGAAVFRTDRDGEVTLYTDGQSLSVTTFTGTRLSLP
jgi:competence protein ComEC